MQDVNSLVTAFSSLPLSSVVSSLAALSMATERLVEMVKNVIPALNQTNSDPIKESWRNFALRTLAVVAGMLIAYMTHTQIGGVVDNVWKLRGGVFVLGLLASGGSGFWNAILKYLGALKDVKLGVAEETKSAEVVKKDAVVLPKDAVNPLNPLAPPAAKKP